MRSFLALLFFANILVSVAPARASDHADPALPAEFNPELSQEPNIMGLFTFPADDRLVVIFTVYPRLSIDPPYALDEYEFIVYMDLTSEVGYEDAEARARYGGQIADPAGIEPDVTIAMRLSAQAGLTDKQVSGLKNSEQIRWYAGVRDDPFIFTPFFGFNAIAMVISIPMSAFPDGQQDWILWGNTRKRGETDIIDHVGRGLRTQLPRFGFINTLPPSQHVAAIERKSKKSAAVSKFVMDYIAPAANLWTYVGAIRYYDAAPDVSIYTTRFPAGFPNGRRLEDDVAAISCPFGECILNELAITEGQIWPRPTTNDKPFLPDFPYLAEPWPSKPPAPAKHRLLAPQTTVKLVIGIVVGLFLLNIYLLVRCWRRSREAG